eukprot:265626_1
MSKRKLLDGALDPYTEVEEKHIFENEPAQPPQTTDEIQNENTHPNHTEDEKEIQLAVIKDETIDTTADTIINTLSWTNAAVFQLAMVNTFYIESWNNLPNIWFLFIISLIFAVILTPLPLFWIDTTSKTFKKHMISDENNENNIYDIEEIKRPFWSRFEYLLIASIALVVSMEFRDASKLTFEQEFIERNNVDTAAYILYAMIWTIIGIWITIQLTNRQDRLKKQMIKSGIFEDDNNNNNNNKIIKYFAVKQRYLILILTTISLIMAWSWRTALDNFILSMYGGDKLTTAHVWSYCIVMTLTISFLVSLSKHFYCLYPRDNEAQQLFVKSRTVKETNKLISDNCKFVVAFAWYDAIKMTVYYNGTSYIVFNVLILYWSVAMVMIFISIYTTNRFKEQAIREKIEMIGVENEKWIGKTKSTVKKVILSLQPDSSKYKKYNIDENINMTISDENKSELTFTHYQMPKICKSFGITIIILTTACWSTSGALFIGDAVKYSILAMYFDISAYDVTMGYSRNDTGLWVQWLAVIGTLCVSAFVMLYLK